MYANKRVVESRFAWPTTCVKGRIIFFSFFLSSFFLLTSSLSLFSSVVKLIHLSSDNLLSQKYQNKRLCPKDL
jgi:hypothetical protein